MGLLVCCPKEVSAVSCRLDVLRARAGGVQHGGWPVHVSGHHPLLWPMAAENGLHWTSVQELFEAKLEPSIQSIILALFSYFNVHQCPSHSLVTSHIFHS